MPTVPDSLIANRLLFVQRDRGVTTFKPRSLARLLTLVLILSVACSGTPQPPLVNAPLVEASPTVAATAKPSPTVTPSPTAAPTSTAVPTSTPRPTVTNTPSPVPTRTATATATSAPLPTFTVTVMHTPIPAADSPAAGFTPAPPPPSVWEYPSRTATVTPVPITFSPEDRDIAYDGFWIGGTEHGQDICFEILDGSITSISVGFDIPGCEGDSPMGAYYGTPE